MGAWFVAGGVTSGWLVRAYSRRRPRFRAGLVCRCGWGAFCGAVGVVLGWLASALRGRRRRRRHSSATGTARRHLRCSAPPPRIGTAWRLWRRRQRGRRVWRWCGLLARRGARGGGTGGTGPCVPGPPAVAWRRRHQWALRSCRRRRCASRLRRAGSCGGAGPCDGDVSEPAFPVCPMVYVFRRCLTDAGASACFFPFSPSVCVCGHSPVRVFLF